MPLIPIVLNSTLYTISPPHNKPKIKRDRTQFYLFLFYSISGSSSLIGSCAPSSFFMVLIPKIKNRIWNNQTQPSIIWPIGTLIIITQPIAISTVTTDMILILTFQVIPLPFTKDSKFFLYSLVLINQLCNFSELLAKQKAANNKNGNAGIRGSTAPTAPKAKPTQPNTINRIFFTFSCLLLQFLFL